MSELRPLTREQLARMPWHVRNARKQRVMALVDAADAATPRGPVTELEPTPDDVRFHAAQQLRDTWITTTEQERNWNTLAAAIGAQCADANCTKPSRATGLCDWHYRQMKRLMDGAA